MALGKGARADRSIDHLPQRDRSAPGDGLGLIGDAREDVAAAQQSPRVGLVVDPQSEHHIVPSGDLGEDLPEPGGQGVGIDRDAQGEPTG